MDYTIAARREQAQGYDFRDIHPNVRFGTASDRYAGWIGQIYPEHYTDQVSTRPRKLGAQTFEERMLPVESVQDYFAHFSVLELDFTFYRPLKEADGRPSPNLFVLQQYAENAPEDAVFLLKVPQTYFARTLRRSSGGQVRYEDNPAYLDAEAYLAQFHEPAVQVLGERLGGFLFEQEYQRVSESPDPQGHIAALDDFFARVPTDVQAHIELRSEHLLVPAYFDWLEHRGIGHVFSHWTWLPPIRKQWRLCGGRFTAADGTAVARLLTPLGVKYEQAYATAYPFDQPVPEIVETPQARDMVLDAVALTYQAERQDALLNLIANNRAWGNAPALAQTIAHRVLDEEEKRQD
jgi:uncharacterized protein YecE (DUF72 family)